MMDKGLGKKVFTLLRRIDFLVFLWCMVMVIPSIDAKETIIISISGIREEEHAFQLSKTLTDELGKKMGISIKLISLPPIRSSKMLSKGTLHAEFSRVAGFQKKVPSAIRVNEPIGEIPFYVFTYRDDITVNGWESLMPYTIVTIRGSTFVDVHLKNHRTHPTGSMLSALKFLNAKRADLLVADPMTPAHILDSPAFEGKTIKRLEPPVDHLPLYTFFSYKHLQYARMYHDALIEIKKEGLYQKLLKTLP